MAIYFLENNWFDFDIYKAMEMIWWRFQRQQKWKIEVR